MHGGAPSSLLAGELERILGAGAEPGTLQPARLTIDLERPVTLVPLTVEVEVVRPGRKVRVAEARLLDDRGNRMARATLLGIRRTEPLDLSSAVTMPVDPPPPLPSQAVAMEVPTLLQHTGGKMFHADAVEHRVVRGTWGVIGPATDWIRLTVEVVAGRAVTPLQRVAAAADFGNGVSAALPPGWTFINPDLTVTLHRLPAGEWVCIDAGTHLGPDGTGTAESELWDERGRLGRSIQTLVIDPPAEG